MISALEDINSCMSYHSDGALTKVKDTEMLLYVLLRVIRLGRGPDMTLVHPPPPHILANLHFFEPLGCPEYEIGL